VIECMSELPVPEFAALLAQLADPGIDTPEEVALIFSGPRFFVALVSGLVLTFGFQLLLTNLSVAAGISYLGRSSSSSQSDDSSSSGGGSNIGAALGIWTLITVSLALFFACLLAIKMTLLDSVLLGAITSLVIWGTYFCLLFWVSSTTVGSLVGSVVRRATTSFQALVGTATAALGAKATSNRVVETAEVTAAAVREELTGGWDGDDLKEALQEYVTTIRSPRLDTTELEAEFERLVEESDLTELGDRDALSRLDRDAFEELVSSRTDLSRQEVERVAGRLYRSWRSALSRSGGSDPTAELADYLRSARPEALLSEELGTRLDEFLDEYRRHRRARHGGILTRAAQSGLRALKSAVIDRGDLSDLDVEKVTSKLKQIQSQLGSGVDGGSPREEESIVRADVETYLLQAYPWQLERDRLEAEFHEVIFDPAADPFALREELKTLHRGYFADVLGSRGLLTPAEIDRTAETLDRVRQQVQEKVDAVYRLRAAEMFRREVHGFLQTAPRDELLGEAGETTVRQIASDPDATAGDLRDRFALFDEAYFHQVLMARGDLDSEQTDKLAHRYARILHEVRSDAASTQQAVQARMQNQWQAVQEHLSRTNRAELDPEGIKADMRTLLQEPDAGAHRLWQRLASFDRESLVRLLSQRDDVSENEARQIVNEVESAWYQVINAPAELSAQVKARYAAAAEAIADYLRSTGKPELNPKGIKRDLQLLMDNPRIGFSAMRMRLSEMDRDTLVQLLSQRDDLSEADANRIVDDFLQSARDVLDAPRRLARRTQAKVLSFEQALEDYLRSTDKAELNPEGIKRDLQTLLDDPRLGGQRLQTRLSHIDRDTVVALLAQREDMTREEAEATVGRVLAVRDQIQVRVHAVRERAEAAIQSILTRIRNYLNSLERPELNYYGIKNDLRQLFDDPQAGLEALKLRLSEFDRETLVALLSSHDAISEADANQLIEQIESTRDRVIAKAERVEAEVESRVSQLKRNAQQQVEETRKAAQAAAWWLFGTATVSAIAAALGGSLAVLG